MDNVNGIHCDINFTRFYRIISWRRLESFVNIYSQLFFEEWMESEVLFRDTYFRQTQLFGRFIFRGTLSQAVIINIFELSILVISKVIAIINKFKREDLNLYLLIFMLNFILLFFLYIYIIDYSHILTIFLHPLLNVLTLSLMV